MPRVIARSRRSPLRMRERVAANAYRRRWLILLVLNISLLVIVVDNSILNVAIPSIVRQLGASTSELQWIVDSYTLVFAGLLLTAGSLGDRFGRLPALQFGLTLFGIGSLLAAMSSTSGQLIATRAFMGIGGAFIMPATLSIIANVFPAPERGKAIGVWAATAGVAIALGPLIGGFLLEHFYWGSVFLVNLPIVALGLLAGVFLIPDSKDPAAPRLDPVGAIASIIGLSLLLYAVIEAPTKGWTTSSTVLAFTLGGVVAAFFFWWELHTDVPMLDLRFFKNPRFSAGSGAISAVFFAMFGSIFVLTQYFQFVLGYSALQTGVRLLAWAVPTMIVAPLSAKVVERIGTKLTVAGGLSLVSLGLLLFTGVNESSAYFPGIMLRMVLMSTGMALTMAPATDSIMGSLPLAKAGVGSAMNDTTRQVGGAVGVAVVGSVFTSVYASHLADGMRGAPIPPPALDTAQEGIGNAFAVATRLGGQTGADLVATAKAAFVDAFHVGLYVGAGVALIGAIAVLIWMPARARREDVERQELEYTLERSDVRPEVSVAASPPRGTPDPATGAH
jgi:EmrB/QacA subfamily drug resistance transporter